MYMNLKSNLNRKEMFFFHVLFSNDELVYYLQYLVDAPVDIFYVILVVNFFPSFVSAVKQTNNPPSS